jgi:hypothetical protein
MNISLRRITHLPIAELWRDDMHITTTRERYVTGDDVKALLKLGAIQFVVAELDTAPRWLPLDHCHTFWKSELQLHLAHPDSKISLDDFPEGYCYLASLWNSASGKEPLVVCEKLH